MIVLMCCCTPTTNFSTAVFKVPITFEIKKALVWVKKRLHNRLWDKLKTVQHNMTTLQCRAGFFFFFRVVKTQTLLETQQLNKSKDLCKGGQEGPLLPRSSESKVEPQRRRRKKNFKVNSTLESSTWVHLPELWRRRYQKKSEVSLFMGAGQKTHLNALLTKTSALTSSCLPKFYQMINWKFE